MNEFLAISSIIILAAVSPGPDFAIVVKNSLQNNRKAGIITALGVSCSLIIHSIYSILGLALVISQSLLLFNIIKYIGAAYLIYIGIKSLKEKRSTIEIKESTQMPLMNLNKLFLQGLLCNLLNPKAILFILAFFTLIVKPSTDFSVQLIYVLDIALIHLIWFSSLAIIVTHPQVQKKLSQFQYYVVKILGLALIGFGTRIAMLSQVIG